MITPPHQSLRAKYPGITIAAKELNVGRAHLHKVLSGTRSSRRTTALWKDWLRRNPQFAAIQPRK